MEKIIEESSFPVEESSFSMEKIIEESSFPIEESSILYMGLGPRVEPAAILHYKCKCIVNVL